MFRPLSANIRFSSERLLVFIRFMRLCNDSEISSSMVLIITTIKRRGWWGGGGSVMYRYRRFRRNLRYLSLVSIVCCQVQVSAAYYHSSRDFQPSVLCLSVIVEPRTGGLGRLGLSSHEKEKL